MKKRKIRIQRVSSWDIGITIVLAVLFVFVYVMGERISRTSRHNREVYHLRKFCKAIAGWLRLSDGAGTALCDDGTE